MSENEEKATQRATMKTAEEIYTEHECSKKSEIIEAMKAYARQCCEKVRQDCAENAKVTGDPFNISCIQVDKQSILSTEILTP